MSHLYDTDINIYMLFSLRTVAKYSIKILLLVPVLNSKPQKKDSNMWTPHTTVLHSTNNMFHKYIKNNIRYAILHNYTA